MTQEPFNPQYLVALDEIYHSHWAARKRRRIGFLKEAFHHFWPEGHPSRLVQITGTNGKGTVSHYLQQALRFAGPTGSWTGPHVFDYAERFHINGEIVSHEEIATIYHQALRPCQDWFMQKHPGESLSFAELGILLSLHLFERHKVEWGIMEVGAGGRYTPLMALPMQACLLTNIGDDHPQTLGTESWLRALEKAGIARKGVPFFSSAEGKDAYYVRVTAESEGAEVVEINEQDLAVIPHETEAPAFQRRNRALAVKMIRHFYPEQQPKVLAAEMTGALTGRFGNPETNVIVDVAHNPDKMARFIEQLTHRYPNRKFRFLIGLTRNRDASAVFAPILPVAERIVITGASYAGRDPGELAALLKPKFANTHAIDDPQEAYTQERALLGPDDLLVLTGSAYMLDQALNPNPYIRHTNASFGRRGSSI